MHNTRSKKYISLARYSKGLDSDGGHGNYAFLRPNVLSCSRMRDLALGPTG